MGTKNSVSVERIPYVPDLHPCNSLASLAKNNDNMETRLNYATIEKEVIIKFA